MGLSWARMKKDQRKIYLEHRDEQRAIEEELRVIRAVELEAARKKVVAYVSLDGSLQVKALDIEYTKMKCFGYQETRFCIPSKLLFYVEAFGAPLAFRVDFVFRPAVGILFPKRRRLIRQAMPPSVELLLGVHAKYGGDLICVAPADLHAWVDKAAALLRKPHQVA